MRLDAPASVRRPLALTPLIDVVFLLLLFFMLASTFQKYGEIDLATVGAGADTATANRPLLLRIHPDGTLDLNAQTVELDGLEKALASAVTDGDTRVLVQVKAGAQTQSMVDVLERVRELGVKQIMLSR